MSGKEFVLQNFYIYIYMDGQASKINCMQVSTQRRQTNEKELIHA